ncbi:MAG: carboxy terminal-processing peptidase [Spirosomataceae bacterium]
MKKYLLSFLPFLMLSLEPSIPSHSAHTKANPGDLIPSVSQAQVSRFVTQILTSYHYRKVNLGDSLSSKVYDNYLKFMDNGKNYLLASDVQGFEKYRYSLDDFLRQGDLTAAFDMYNTLLRRIKARNQFVAQTLEKPFDFSKDETFDTNREKAQWAKSEQELDDVWYKILKNQALELKLGNKADTAITKLLKDRYKLFDKQIAKVKSEDVFNAFMNSFTECVDPHTAYFIPKTAGNFNMEMSQSFEGIGATLRNEGDYVKVVDLLPGPAMKSGLVQKEDKLLAVGQGDNGPMVDVVGWFTDEVVQLIRGPKGTTVRLSLQSADALPGAPPKEIKLVRDKIKIEEQRAKAEVVPITENGKTYNLGVISLPLFYRDFSGASRQEKDYSSTTRDVQKLIQKLTAENKIDGLVMDLRNNGGGSLVEAINLTGLFISQGPVVQVRDAEGSIEVDKDDDPAVVYSGPLAVLVNRFSASASEIFAGAIQDYHRGIVVGEQTFGKGTVQSMIDLTNFLPKDVEKPGQLNLTRAKFYRITGSSTQHKGVTPDIQLPSGFDADKFGESAEPSALPWDQIKATSYNQYQDVDDKILVKIREQYTQRLKSDPELKKLAEDFVEFKKAREKTVVSLQETKRRLEREEQEKKRLALNKSTAGAASASEDGDTPDDTRTASANTPKAKLDKDVYLKECGRVLADLIALHK